MIDNMTDIQTLTREKIKLEEPSLYDVIFLNDNITTMEFVIRVLKQIFNKNQHFVNFANFDADYPVRCRIASLSIWRHSRSPKPPIWVGSMKS